MKTTRLLGIALATASLTAANAAGKDLQGTRDVLDQWVETKQMISKENTDWTVEQSILADTLTLLRNELDRINNAIEELEGTTNAADADRAKLTEEKDALTAGSAVVENQIGALETQMKRIVATLPKPLIEKIKPLMRRLPEDPANTKLSLGERVQNIVGILSQADKFNTTITLTSDTREVQPGKVVQVSTIYWGLAIAYFTDDSGNFAGIGTPGSNGWQWSQVDGSGTQIKQLLEIYEGTADIQFVDAPARVN